jgi:hypothetical protein
MDNKITHACTAKDYMAALQNKKQDAMKKKKDEVDQKEKERLDAIQSQVNQRSFKEPVRNIYFTKYGF